MEECVDGVAPFLPRQWDRMARRSAEIPVELIGEEFCFVADFSDIGGPSSKAIVEVPTTKASEAGDTVVPEIVATGCFDSRVRLPVTRPPIGDLEIAKVCPRNLSSLAVELALNGSFEDRRSFGDAAVADLKEGSMLG